MNRHAIAVVLTALLPAAAGALELAEVNGLDEAAWGAAMVVDGKRCRSLKAGLGGKIPLATWWGDRLRPMRDDSRKALVVYKDTATSPIRVRLYAALPGHYEIHRIGGTADGKWKTAAIPLPWDMVARLPDTEPDRTEMLLNAPRGADVPVKSVTIVEADADADERAWCAETRAWVARVQADKRAEAKGPVTERPAALPGKRAVIPFVRSTARLIHCTSAPQEGECNVPIRIRMALNETEPAQFGVYAAAALTGVRAYMSPGGFVSADGHVLVADVEILTAEYSVVRKGHLFPQRLWPAYPVDIPHGRSHLFWLNVTTQGKKHTRPGLYRGSITIESSGPWEEYIPVEIEVLPITLLTMKEAKLHMGSCVTGLLPAHELEFLARQNHNSINLWYYGFAPAIEKRSRTDFGLTFTIQDDFMEHARRAGIENFVYFLGGDPYGFPDTLHLERELYRRVINDGDDLMAGRLELLRKSGAAPNTMLPELRKLYVKWVEEFMWHARQHHWPEPILTPFDEPAKWVQGNWAAAKLYYWKDPKSGGDHVGRARLRDLKKFMAERKAEGVTPEFICNGGAGEWIKPHFKDSCAAIHEGFDGARVYGSIHHAKPGIVFLDDVDVFCTNAIHEDKDLGDKVRAGGGAKTFWQYSGTGDSTEPAASRYTFGFFFGAFDSRGSLCWAYNWGNRFDTTSGNNWLYGWTTPYSVVRAPFMEGMREAWDDRRYIETLKVRAQKYHEAEADELLNEIFDQAVKTRTEGGRDTVHDFWARTDDPEALDTMRSKVANMILLLEGHGVGQ